MLRQATKHVASRAGVDGALSAVAYETRLVFVDNEDIATCRAVEKPGSPPPVPTSPFSHEFVLCHAAGFCKEVWNPVIRALQSRGVGGVFHTLDLSGHGESAAAYPVQAPRTSSSDALPLSERPTWWDFANDVVAVCHDISARHSQQKPLESHGAKAPRRRLRVGVGHSLGGAATVLAEIMHPGLFDRIVLIEPILIGPPGPHDQDPEHLALLRKKNPMVPTTQKRRNYWKTRAEATEYFQSRRAFRNFDADAIREFVSHGLAVDRDQSSDEAPSGLHLKCNPAFEAEIYAMPKTGIWADDFNAVDAPILMVTGETSTHLSNVQGNSKSTAEYCAEIAGFFPQNIAPPIVVRGASHFVVMEQPETIASLVAEAVTAHVEPRAKSRL